VPHFRASAALRQRRGWRSVHKDAPPQR